VLFVQSCAQKFSGLEERTGPERDFDRDARSWVPARARLAMPDREGTEATYLDPTAVRVLAHAMSRGASLIVDDAPDEVVEMALRSGLLEPAF